MRKLDLIRDGDELYEVVRRIAYSKFTKSVEGENATLLKEWARCEKILKSNQTKASDLRKWVGCEKILKSNQTNEYLFVNLIEEAIIDDE